MEERRYPLHQLRFLSEKIRERISKKLKKENFKMFSDKDIDSIEQALQDLPDGRYEKKSLKETSTSLEKILGRNENIYGVVKMTVSGEPHYFAIGETIGTGAFAKAKLAQDLKTGDWYVLKIQETKSTEKNVLKLADNISLVANREINALNALSKGIGGIIQREVQRGIDAELIETQFIILMRLTPGRPITHFIDNSSSYDFTQLLPIAEGILKKQIEFIQHGYIHGDLSPANVFYNEEEQDIDFIDLANTSPITPETKNTTNVASDITTGTLAYLAPERRSNAPASEKSEVYAAGLIFMELFGYGKLSGFGGRIIWKDQVKESVKQGNSTDPLLNLIISMTNPDPAKRPTFSEALKQYKALDQGKINQAINKIPWPEQAVTSPLVLKQLERTLSSPEMTRKNNKETKELTKKILYQLKELVVICTKKIEKEKLKEWTTLLEKNKENLSKVLQDMSKEFDENCKELSKSSGLFMKFKKAKEIDPIKKMRDEPKKHHLTRGIGLIFKNLTAAELKTHNIFLIYDVTDLKQAEFKRSMSEKF